MQTFAEIVSQVEKLTLKQKEDLQDILETLLADEKRKEMLSKMEVVKSHSYDEARILRDKL